MKIMHSFIISILIISLLACSNRKYSQYIDDNNPNTQELYQLFPLLNTYRDYSENRFTVMSKIINQLMGQSNTGKLNLLITDYIEQNPKDPYNSYYLLNLASEYLKKGKNEFAIPYLHRAVMDFNDLTVRGESTHYKALEILLNVSKDNEKKVIYYKKLIRDHRDIVEKRTNYTGGVGELYYYLGQTLENLEKWEESIDAYESYLEFGNATIAKEPDARDKIIKKVGFYHSDKSWVVNDLETLVANVKYAIAVKNPSLLDRYRSFDFFIINWNSDFSDLRSSFPMESQVLTTMSIKTYKNLDPMSTEDEAYLAVYGNQWSSSIWFVYPKWYFYFKRVDFPMNPNIHGGWEWAGIFLGEKV